MQRGEIEPSAKGVRFRELAVLGRKELAFTGLIFIILVGSLYLNLGIAPLILEEPRRALVALEMVYNKNLIVATQLGDFYYSKPPLYNWLIIVAYKLFGNYSEFACRFFSVLSFLVMGALIFFMGKRYIGKSFGVYSSLLFLVTGELYYYFSILGEIDLFYALLTFGSFAALFHFHQTRHYYLLFLVTYFLGAMGTLTKGFPSIVFLAISIPVFFAYYREPRKLISLPHFLGIVLYSIIVLGYLALYSRYNPLDGFIGGLWSQVSQRTVLGKGTIPLYQHVLVFPVDTLIRNLPVSLLIVFTWRKNFLKQVRSARLVEFSFLLLVCNIIIYWVSPGTRSRYIYMLYPFITIILTYFYLQNAEIGGRGFRIFRILGGAVILLVVAVCCLSPFIPQTRGLEHVGVTAIIAGSVGLVLFMLFIKKPKLSLLALISTMVVFRFVFDLTVLPLRASEGGPFMNKDSAGRIVEVVGEEPLYVYGSSRVGLDIVFYLEQQRKEVLYRRQAIDNSDFFLAEKAMVHDQRYRVYHSFLFKSTVYGDLEMVLIKFI